MMQIKCPFPATHIRYLLESVVPEEYEPQCIAEIDVCERDWNDFVSFCPEMPEKLQLFIVRVHRNEGRILTIRSAVKEFNEEVSEVISQLWAGQHAMEELHVR